MQKEGAVLSKNRALCEPVGDGVFEFKLRYNLKDLTSRLGLPYKPTGAEDTQNVMLRVFFHQHGSEIVLLLHGYDKGKNPSKRHQQAQIRLAKERKNKWIARKAREAKQAISSAEEEIAGNEQLDDLWCIGHNEPNKKKRYDHVRRLHQGTSRRGRG